MAQADGSNDDNVKFEFAEEPIRASDSDVSLDDPSLSDDSDYNLRSSVSELGLAEPTAEKPSKPAPAATKSTSTKTAVKSTPVKPASTPTKASQEKPAVDATLLKLFDESAQITSTARQHVETAYKTVDPNDPESRKQARDALRQSLTVFAKKALASGALSSQQVAALFQSANNFAGALLLFRREKNT